MRKRTLILGTIIFVLLSYFVYIIFEPSEQNDASKFANEYTEISKDNIFKYKSSEEVLNMLKSGTGIIYFGYPESKWCQAYVKMLNEVGISKEALEIGYYNIKKDINDNTSFYQKLILLLGDTLNIDNDGNYKLFVPKVIFIKNGEIIGFDNESSMLEGNISPDEYWVSSRKDALKQRLGIYFDEVLNGTCDERC